MVSPAQMLPGNLDQNELRPRPEHKQLTSCTDLQGLKKGYESCTLRSPTQTGSSHEKKITADAEVEEATTLLRGARIAASWVREPSDLFDSSAPKSASPANVMERAGKKATLGMALPHSADIKQQTSRRTSKAAATALLLCYIVTPPIPPRKRASFYITLEVSHLMDLQTWAAAYAQSLLEPHQALQGAS